MKIEDLVGEHELTGVDFDSLPPCLDDYRYDSANVMYFALDGLTYAAAEDPSDGYRSSMQDLTVSERAIMNVFSPVKVLGVYRPKGSYGSDDILEMIDCVTGKVVLRFGTSNTDDYYPSYVADFTPENMACNQGGKC